MEQEPPQGGASKTAGEEAEAPLLAAMDDNNKNSAEEPPEAAEAAPAEAENMQPTPTTKDEPKALANDTPPENEASPAVAPTTSMKTGSKGFIKAVTRASTKPEAASKSESRALTRGASKTSQSTSAKKEASNKSSMKASTSGGVAKTPPPTQQEVPQAPAKAEAASEAVVAGEAAAEDKPAAHAALAGAPSAEATADKPAVEYEEITRLEKTPPKDMFGTTEVPTPQTIVAHPLVELKSGCCGKPSYYVFNQSFVVVRHADRLDNTSDWETHPDRSMWPNDPPLAKKGQLHAQDVAVDLQKSGSEFKAVVCSPYLRCIQTASIIADCLKIPLRVDNTLGEIFDDQSIQGASPGSLPPHRTSTELQEPLKAEFPGVQCRRGSKGQIYFAGKPPTYPEKYEHAFMRYAFAVHKIVQQSAEALEGVIIVSHGDAVKATATSLRPNSVMWEVPPGSYFLATRQVRILEQRGSEVLRGEPVYTGPYPIDVALENSLSRKEQTVTARLPSSVKEEMLEVARKSGATPEDVGAMVALLNTLPLSALNLSDRVHDAPHALAAAQSSRHSQTSRSKQSPGGEEMKTTDME